MKAYLRKQFGGSTVIPAKLTAVDTGEETIYNGTEGLEADYVIGKPDFFVRLNGKNYKAEITNFDIR